MELNSEKREKYEKYTHVKFIEIYNYLSDKTYSEHRPNKQRPEVKFPKSLQEFRSCAQ